MTDLQTVRLYGRALNSRWPIPDESKAAIIDELMGLATMAEKESVRVAACKVLVAAEMQNQKDEHSHVQEIRERILAIATQFGIDLTDGGAGQAIAGPAIGGTE